MHKRNVHVFHNETHWVVEQEGQPNVKMPYPTRSAAVDAAKRMAKQNRAELVIHRVNGSVAERNTYMCEQPNPPSENGSLERVDDDEEMATA